MIMLCRKVGFLFIDENEILTNLLSFLSLYFCEGPKNYVQYTL